MQENNQYLLETVRAPAIPTEIVIQNSLDHSDVHSQLRTTKMEEEGRTVPMLAGRANARSWYPTASAAP